MYSIDITSFKPALLYFSTPDYQDDLSSGVTRGAGEGGRLRAQVQKGAHNEPAGIYFDKLWGSNGPQRGAKLGLCGKFCK